jgi:ParB family chromosome partitioning protein
MSRRLWKSYRLNPLHTPCIVFSGTVIGLAYEVPAGGRRFRALELLVKQKRMAKTQPVPCVVRQDGIAEEDSLAENVQRVALHPLDQFRAFQALRDAGLGEEEIAARFRQRDGGASASQAGRGLAEAARPLRRRRDDARSARRVRRYRRPSAQEQVWENLAREVGETAGASLAINPGISET